MKNSKFIAYSSISITCLICIILHIIIIVGILIYGNDEGIFSLFMYIIFLSIFITLFLWNLILFTVELIEN